MSLGNILCIYNLQQCQPIALYLPFENRVPAGRYWFKGLPLYLKLDVSFHESDEYKWLIREGEIKYHRTTFNPNKRLKS